MNFFVAGGLEAGDPRGRRVEGGDDDAAQLVRGGGSAADATTGPGCLRRLGALGGLDVVRLAFRGVRFR